MAFREFALIADETFFAAKMLALEFHVNAVGAEGAGEAIEDLFRRKRGSVAGIVRLDRADERAFVIAGEGDEAGGELGKFIPAK